MTGEGRSLADKFGFDWTTSGMMRVATACFILFAAIFLPFPEIDLLVAEIFYNGNNDFWLRKTQFNVIKNDILRPMVGYIAVAGLLAFLFFWWRAPMDKVRRLARYAFLLVCIALSTGLVVHAVFKDHWDRARPKQVVEFDGERVFTPPLIPVNECERNCSFVSGDASLGFVFMSLALYAANRRRFWIGVTLGAGLFMGSLRMMNGSHFLSDILFSGVFTCFTVLLLYRWFEEKRFKEDVGILYPIFAGAWSIVRRLFELLPIPKGMREGLYARSRALFPGEPEAPVESS